MISFFQDKILLKRAGGIIRRIGTTGVIIGLDITGTAVIMRRVGSVIGRISDLIGSIVITGVIVFVDVIIRRSVIIMGNIRTSIIILGGICIRGGCVRTSGIIRGIVVIIAVLGIDRKSGILRFGLLLGFCLGIRLRQSS